MACLCLSLDDPPLTYSLGSRFLDPNQEDGIWQSFSKPLAVELGLCFLIILFPFMLSLLTLPSFLSRLHSLEVINMARNGEEEIPAKDLALLLFSR